jgi:hypothetical protein
VAEWKGGLIQSAIGEEEVETVSKRREWGGTALPPFWSWRAGGWRREQLRGKIYGNGGCKKRRGALVSVGCVVEGRGTMERLREGRSDEGKGKSEG